MGKAAASSDDRREKCPFCGQVLIDRQALIHLQRSRGAHDRKVKEQVDRATRGLKAELAKERRQLKADYDQKRRQLRAELKKELKPLIAEEARRLERRRLVAERAKEDAEFQRRERSLRQKIKRLENLLENQKEENERLQRATERLAPGERGEFTEEDIKNLLADQFAEDRVWKTRRGKAGSDIFQEVRVNGGAIGLILYECKDTTRWMNSYVTQCREQGKRHKTSYLVLVSKAFPPKQKDFFVRDGVVVVHPSCVAELAGVMRRMVIEVAEAGLSVRGQARKVEELYEYVQGQEFRDSVASIIKRARDLKLLLQRERVSHQKAWTQREQAYEFVAESSVAFDTRIRGIVQAHQANGKVVPIRRKGSGDEPSRPRRVRAGSE